MKAVHKLIVVGLIGVCFGILGGLFGAEAYFRAYSPRRPDPDHGYTYPVSVQERTPVYLNARQWYWFESPTSEMIYWPSFAVSACGAYFLNKRWGVFR